MRAHALLAVACAGAALLPCLAFLSCTDPVHDDEVAALGPDTEPTGPDHRPGQPCLVCHGGQGPASSQFSVAGTLYLTANASQPAPNATVFVEDSAGSTYNITANSAGNFYVTSGLYLPQYPMFVSVTSASGSVTQKMTSYANDGSCGECHTLVPGPSSAGPVYVNSASAATP